MRSTNDVAKFGSFSMMSYNNIIRECMEHQCESDIDMLGSHSETDQDEQEENNTINNKISAESTEFTQKYVSNKKSLLQHKKPAITKQPKQCAVCGKSATCYHFDVPSCVGCSSFFRRCVLHQKTYCCKRGGTCCIDQSESCRSCRFDKCVLVGMNVHTFRTDLNIAETAMQLDKHRAELIQRISANENTKNPLSHKESEISSTKHPKQCVVCRKSSKFCHFDVPSCMGCRSFFRRSVLHQRTYCCKKGGGNCRIDQSESCRACRFDKCVLVGMNVHAFRTHLNVSEAAMQLDKHRAELIQRISGNKSIEQQISLRLVEEMVRVEMASHRIRYSENELPKNFYFDKASMDFVYAVDNKNNTMNLYTHFLENPMFKQSASFNDKMMLNGHHMESIISFLYVDTFLCLQVSKTMPAIQQLPTKDKFILFCSNLLTMSVFSQCFYSAADNSDASASPSALSPHEDKMFLDSIEEPFRRIAMSSEEFVMLRAILLFQTGCAKLSDHAKNLLDAEVERHSKALMCCERFMLGEEQGIKRYAELIFFMNFALRVSSSHRAWLDNLFSVVNTVHNSFSVRLYEDAH
uniref:Nuclear receptor n=1 Tax=Globodera pallida TaxID=36090 RepID=A0A183BVC8_GLOPA